MKDRCHCGEPITDTVLGLCRKHEREYDAMLDERYRLREERGDEAADVRFHAMHEDGRRW